MPSNVENILNEFVKGVSEILGKRLKEIILYGSYARGDYDENSDIDIMILTDLNDDEIIEYRQKIWDFSYDMEYDNNFDIQISPLIKNIDDFNEYADCVPFCMNIQKEGVILSEQ